MLKNGRIVKIHYTDSTDNFCVLGIDGDVTQVYTLEDWLREEPPFTSLKELEKREDVEHIEFLNDILTTG